MRDSRDTGEEGQLSLEALFAAFALLCIAVLAWSWTGGLLERQAREMETLEREQYAVFLADSLVKNRDEKQPERGSAVLDPKTRTVQENELDKELLGKIAPEEEGKKFALAGIWLEFEGGEREVFWERKEKRDCAAVERFVLVQGRKGKLEVKVCGNRG